MTVYCHMGAHGRRLRRTTAHEVTRPDGLDGPMLATGRGRDALDDATVREVRVEARAGFDDGKVATIHSDEIDLTPLVGTSAFSGFRAAATGLLGDDRDSVLHQVLDDLPIAFMLSGRVLRVEGIALGGTGRKPPVDLCAGWVAGGSMVTGFTPLGPPLHVGPPVRRTAGDVAPVPRSTARRRATTVRLDGDVAQVVAWFRDSHVDAGGAETVVHEYEVRAAVDRGERRFVCCEATPGTLPSGDCPVAATSVERLVGEPLVGLRDRVTADFTGPSTCTHLNDALRNLEGVGDMIERLERGVRA